MKMDGLTHPKTKELAYSLEIPLPHAIGLLELMWAFVAQKTPQGNIGKWSDRVIAGEAHWEGDASQFVDALVDVGFLVRCSEHRLLVHDWHDHCPNWVRSKLQRAGLEVLTSGPRNGELSLELTERAGPVFSQELSPELSPELRGHYKPSQAKPSQAKTKNHGAAAGRAKRKVGQRIPPGFPGKAEIEWAAKNFPAVDAAREVEVFSDYWAGVPGQRGVKLDWPATWRNWVRRASEKAATAVSRSSGGDVWDALVDAIRRGPEGRKKWIAENQSHAEVVREMGGINMLAGMTERELQFQRKEFIARLTAR